MTCTSRFQRSAYFVTAIHLVSSFAGPHSCAVTSRFWRSAYLVTTILGPHAQNDPNDPNDVNLNDPNGPNDPNDPNDLGVLKPLPA
jgi:hypothetical protein